MGWMMRGRGGFLCQTGHYARSGAGSCHTGMFSFGCTPRMMEAHFSRLFGVGCPHGSQMSLGGACEAYALQYEQPTNKNPSRHEKYIGLWPSCSNRDLSNLC